MPCLFQFPLACRTSCRDRFVPLLWIWFPLFHEPFTKRVSSDIEGAARAAHIHHNQCWKFVNSFWKTFQPVVLEHQALESSQFVHLPRKFSEFVTLETLFILVSVKRGRNELFFAHRRCWRFVKKQISSGREDNEQPVRSRFVSLPIDWTILGGRASIGHPPKLFFFKIVSVNNCWTKKIINLTWGESVSWSKGHSEVISGEHSQRGTVLQVLRALSQTLQEFQRNYPSLSNDRSEEHKSELQ